MTKVKSLAKKAKKNLWSVQGLEKRCQQLIREGLLTQKRGLDAIIKVVNEEFAKQIADAGVKPLTIKLLAKNVSRLIWVEKISNDLWKAINHKLEAKFRETHPWIPSGEVERECKRMKGLTRSTSIAEFKAGMGRLDEDELPPNADTFEFPGNSYHEPFVIDVPNEWQVPIINAALVGIKFPKIENNTLRRALADARLRGAHAVILTNLIELWTKKTAGFLAVYRAKISGIQINPDRFPPDYQQEVRDILSGKITDKMIYQTLNERFVEILDGLHKITHRPDNKGPEFPGPVYILLALKEEEVAAAGSYHKGRYLTIMEQNKLEAELNMASGQLAEAKKERDDAGMKHWSKEVARLGARKARAILTDHTAYQYELFERQIRALVVRKLEAAIPNCKVINQGSTYFKFGDKIVKLHIPHHDKVTDTLLAEAGDSYGFDVMRDILPDLTVVCHPYSLNHRYVGREDSKDGQPITKFIHVAPSCSDGEFLRNEFRGMIRAVHPVQGMVFTPQFKPGVLILSHVNGVLSANSLPIARLDRPSEKKQKNGNGNGNHDKLGHTNFAFPYPDLKYITIGVHSDDHWGSPSKRFIWDPKQGIHLGVHEAMVEMMRRSGAVNASDIRVHGVAELDDATNGNLWFKPHFQPHPREMAIIDIEAWLRQMTNDIRRAAEKGDGKAAVSLTEEMNRLSISQFYFRGEHFPFHQMMMVYDRHLDTLVDYYSAVLGRFVRAGLEVKGLSKINKTLSDTRDVGVLNFPNGNHRIGSLEKADLEGEYFARHIREKLAQLPEWQRYLKEKPNFLKEAVRAPRFSNTTFGLGVIRAKAQGGYPWALRFLSAPPKLSSWSDPLAAFVRSDLARGDSSYGLLKYVVVTIVGDKHFYCKVETERIIYIMSAAGCHTDLYGDMGGFPPNNTGVMFVSLPADGPDAGPVLVHMLPHDYIRDWFANPKPFDWNKFLPNPV